MFGWRRSFRPRETKEYGPKTDVATPLLQYFVAVPVLTLDILILLSWLILLPPVVPWLFGMAISALWFPILWFCCASFLMEKALAPRARACVEAMAAYKEAATEHVRAAKQARVSGSVDDMAQEEFARENRDRCEEHEADSGAHFAAGQNGCMLAHFISTVMALCLSAMATYYYFWDWLETACYSGLFGIPTPHFGGGSLPLYVGATLWTLGAILILWKPSRYTFGLVVSGSLTTIVSWWFRPITLYWSKGASTGLSNSDIIFYGVYLAFSIGLIFPSLYLLKRMFKEMGDDYEYEGVLAQRTREPAAQHQIVPRLSWPPSPGDRATADPVSPMPTIRSVRPQRGGGRKSVNLRMDEFVEGLMRMSTFGVGETNATKPPWKMDCSGRKISQWTHYVELVEPLVQAGIVNRTTGEIHPDFDHDGKLDPLQILEALDLLEYAHMIREDNA